MDGDMKVAARTEALKQVNYHLDRAMDAAKPLDDDAAATLRSWILVAALQATNC